MRVLVIGGGGREHALTWKLRHERGVSDVLCAPGNPGIAAVARCIPADISNPAELLEIATREQVDLTVVGPEVPLSRGVADVFAARGRPILGPTRAAAALEWSKSFAKDFMARHDVPTARFRVCDSADDALAAVARGEFGYPLVIKADGLAAGKGVLIVDDRTSADEAIRTVMVDKAFGPAGDRVVLEEFLSGEEASYFVLADGAGFVPLGSAQDHKRIFDDDRGPNTGGMGAYAPAPRVTGDVETRVLDTIVRPVLEGMRTEGNPFRGFLYVGLMLTADGPKVVEFNVRFGDPEAQVVFPMMDEDLAPLLAEAAAGRLTSRRARFRPEPHVGVVIAAGGYPDVPQSGKAIEGLDAAAAVPGALVFHAGTKSKDYRIVSAGGRVLTVVGRGATHREAIEIAYRAVSHIRFEGMQFRRDIGRRALSLTG
jgi:phosphoribosylamine--glycine ligase